MWFWWWWGWSSLGFVSTQLLLIWMLAGSIIVQCCKKGKTTPKLSKRSPVRLRHSIRRGVGPPPKQILEPVTDPPRSKSSENVEKKEPDTDGPLPNSNNNNNSNNNINNNNNPKRDKNKRKKKSSRHNEAHEAHEVCPDLTPELLMHFTIITNALNR